MHNKKIIISLIAVSMLISACGSEDVTNENVTDTLYLTDSSENISSYTETEASESESVQTETEASKSESMQTESEASEDTALQTSDEASETEDIAESSVTEIETDITEETTSAEENAFEEIKRYGDDENVYISVRSDGTAYCIVGMDNGTETLFEEGTYFDESNYDYDWYTRNGAGVSYPGKMFYSFLTDDCWFYGEDKAGDMRTGEFPEDTKIRWVNLKELHICLDFGEGKTVEYDVAWDFDEFGFWAVDSNGEWTNVIEYSGGRWN